MEIRKSKKIMLAVGLVILAAGIYMTGISTTISTKSPVTQLPQEQPKKIVSEQQAGSETGAPVTLPTGEQGIKCPSDYCLSEVQGAGPCPAWTGKTGEYSEQQCYDYSESADSLKDCDSKRVIYYKICGVRQQ